MDEIGKILFSEEVILSRVGQLGERISSDYAGKDLIMVGILKGAFLFTADLARTMSLPVEIDFLQASSYGDRETSSGNVVMKKDLDTDIEGRHVLLVDTIIDTGRTMDFIIRRLSARRPASLRAAVLLDKKNSREVTVPIAYTGFAVPDLFVVGYGMDFAGRYRNLPDISLLPPASPE